PEALTERVARVPNSSDSRLPDDLDGFDQILLEKQTLDIFETYTLTRWFSACHEMPTSVSLAVGRDTAVHFRQRVCFIESAGCSSWKTRLKPWPPKIALALLTNSRRLAHEGSPLPRR